MILGRWNVAALGRCLGNEGLNSSYFRQHHSKYGLNIDAALLKYIVVYIYTSTLGSLRYTVIQHYNIYLKKKLRKISAGTADLAWGKATFFCRFVRTSIYTTTTTSSIIIIVVVVFIIIITIIVVIIIIIIGFFSWQSILGLTAQVYDWHCSHHNCNFKSGLQVYPNIWR